MSNKTYISTIPGLATSRGFAAGPVFVYRGDGEIPIPQYLIEPGKEEEELTRLRRAIQETRHDIEEVIDNLQKRAGKSDVRVFECHLLLLEDDALKQESEGYVVNNRLNAEAAVRKTTNGAREKFERMNDPYFRERVRDIDDIELRLLKRLTGYARNTHLELRSPSIIVADDLTPSETVLLPREYVLGFATNGGSTTSHVALLARALGIPAVSGLGNITSRVSPGEIILLDGTSGSVTLNPDSESISQFEELVRRQKEFTEEAISGAIAGTMKDGSVIRIYANIHPGIPEASVKALGARGVGLYRSEYLWLDREKDPSEEEQFQAYRRAILSTSRLCDDTIIAIRMLDLGGDKMMRGVSVTEANPFLGNRSIRYLLSHRDVLRTQFRAILRASVFGPTAIMYPMISCVEELKEVTIEYNAVKRQLDNEGIAYNKDIKIGAMIEVPSAALTADMLVPFVDFFSIGTNDLVQYTLAADRGNDSVSYLYQPLHPAIIRLVKMTIEAANTRGIEVAVCGESASDPVVAMFWVALGVHTLSMSAMFIPTISRILLNLTRADLDEYVKIPASLPFGSTASDIYAACRMWLSNKLPQLKDVI